MPRIYHFFNSVSVFVEAKGLNYLSIHLIVTLILCYNNLCVYSLEASIIKMNVSMNVQEWNVSTVSLDLILP